jgi:photosystem II stability/assembly factor-like uncharacterized protein
MYFINQTTGYLGDEYGTILKTTNGGNEWNEKSTGGREFIFSIYFPSPNTGYAMKGYSPGKVLKTTNTGNSWFEISNSTLNHFNSSLYFTDENTGYAAMDYVKKTIDGGLNWEIQNTGISTPHSIYFINGETGYSSGSGGAISKTTNSGSIWNLQNSGITDRLLSIHFVNSSVGYVCGDEGTILKSTNGGQIWTHQNSGISSTLTSVSFTDMSKGHVTSVDGKVLYTSDGGTTWSIQHSENNYFGVVQFLNQDVGYIAPFGSYILKTTTGGILTGFNTAQIELPKEFYLSQNHPNPFNPNTVISYQLTVSSFISLKVYDVLGIEVATLINEKQNSGSYHVEFDGSNFPSGIYFYKLITGEFSEVKKMTMIK